MKCTSTNKTPTNMINWDSNVYLLFQIFEANYGRSCKIQNFKVLEIF